jgi:hypothetical protein
MWADKFYLGWLLRFLRQPRLYGPRYLSAFRLPGLILRYGEEAQAARRSEVRVRGFPPARSNKVEECRYKVQQARRLPRRESLNLSEIRRSFPSWIFGRPRWGLPLPDMGLPLTDIGLSLPDMGLALLDMGLPLPSTGLSFPHIGLRLPNTGLPLPYIGLAFPSTGLSLPYIGL